MNNKAKIKLKDLAEYTGLSINTVSKVINKKPYYTKEVETKVLNAIKELGYIPNSIAKSLRRGSSHTIAIVFDDLINPYYSLSTLTLAQKLSNYKYDVMMFSSFGKSILLDYRLLTKIISRNVDAIISFLEPEPEAIELINKQDLPFLLFGRTTDVSQNVVSVCANDFEGGYIATQHLIDKGYTKISYVGADPLISADKKRFEGYKSALKENGIEFCPQYIGYFSQYKSTQAICHELILKNDANAIVCFNDIFSCGIIKELNTQGYNLPGDYAIVGYDNIQKNVTFPFNLTTIDSDNEAMTDLVVKIILDKIQGRPYPESRINSFPVSLIPGSTT